MSMGISHQGHWSSQSARNIMIWTVYNYFQLQIRFIKTVTQLLNSNKAQAKLNTKQNRFYIITIINYTSSEQSSRHLSRITSSGATRILFSSDITNALLKTTESNKNREPDRMIRNTLYINSFFKFGTKTCSWIYNYLICGRRRQTITSTIWRKCLVVHSITRYLIKIALATKEETVYFEARLSTIRDI